MVDNITQFILPSLHAVGCGLTISDLPYDSLSSQIFFYPAQVEKTSQSTGVFQHRLDILRIEKEAVIHASKHQLLEALTQQLGEPEQLPWPG